MIAIPLKGRLAAAFAAMCLPPLATCWAAAHEVGRMEVLAASGSEAALQAALRSGGDLTFYVAVTAFAGSLMLAAVFLRGLAEPFTVLLSRLEDLAAGEPADRTPYAGRRDGVGRMARAIEACRVRFVEAETARRRHAEASQTFEEERRVVMASLAQGLAALSAARGVVRPAPRPAPVSAPVLVVDNAPRPEEPLRLPKAPETDDGGLRGLLTRLGER